MLVGLQTEVSLRARSRTARDGMRRSRSELFYSWSTSIRPLAGLVSSDSRANTGAIPIAFHLMQAQLCW